VTALIEHVRALIAKEGPLSVERVMGLALSDPTYGYYATRDPFGAAGDFITAPEISQMFGELIGLWCTVTHEQMGAPPDVLLVELGPGRGTLMQDSLRASARIERFCAARRVHLVEASARLRAIQSARLAPEPVSFHERLEDMPPGPILIIANEFFDALPVGQLVSTPDGWRERVVATHGGALCFGVGPSPATNLPTWLPPAQAVPEGTIAEHAPEREQVAALIGQRLARDGGAALIIDYGHGASACGDTLQAVRAHRRVDILAQLGDADLTAHVDFARLARAAERAGARAYGPIGQGRFLQALGIDARATRLMQGATQEQAAQIRSALERLTAPSAMGELFKAMALTAPGLPAPAGFEAFAARAPALAYG